LQNRLPYSYFNARKELVGLDVDMAHGLAYELQCRLEFIPFAYADLAEQLAANHFDVAMSGLPITTSQLLSMQFSEPYLDVSMAFIVRDHRRTQFGSLDRMRKLEPLTIAVPPGHYFRGIVKERLSNAELVVIDNTREFFESNDGRFDAMLLDAESGSAWTFLYPGYRPVIPQDFNVRVPLAYAVARHDRDFVEFLSQWIRLQKQSGELDKLYSYWILGQIHADRPPRWCVLRDVLGVGVD
jgi:ABC-type amino acid transport substrate-binding protein